MVRIQKRVTLACWRLEHFTTNVWNVTNDNVYRLLGLLNPKDAVTFDFNLKDIDWDDYVYTYSLAVRRYLLKDDDSTAEAARARLTRYRQLLLI
jgi:fatty acyl-CoA reductase